MLRREVAGRGAKGGARRCREVWVEAGLGEVREDWELAAGESGKRPGPVAGRRSAAWREVLDMKTWIYRSGLDGVSESAAITRRRKHWAEWAANWRAGGQGARAGWAGGCGGGGGGWVSVRAVARESFFLSGQPTVGEVVRQGQVVRCGRNKEAVNTCGWSVVVRTFWRAEFGERHACPARMRLDSPICRKAPGDCITENPLARQDTRLLALLAPPPLRRRSCGLLVHHHATCS